MVHELLRQAYELKLETLHRFVGNHLPNGTENDTSRFERAQIVKKKKKKKRKEKRLIKNQMTHPLKVSCYLVVIDEHLHVPHERPSTDIN